MQKVQRSARARQSIRKSVPSLAVRCHLYAVACRVGSKGIGSAILGAKLHTNQWKESTCYCSKLLGCEIVKIGRHIVRCEEKKKHH